jgi:hypothetical protein
VCYGCVPPVGRQCDAEKLTCYLYSYTTLNRTAPPSCHAMCLHPIRAPWWSCESRFQAPIDVVVGRGRCMRIDMRRWGHPSRQKVCNRRRRACLLACLLLPPGPACRWRCRRARRRGQALLVSSLPRRRRGLLHGGRRGGTMEHRAFGARSTVGGVVMPPWQHTLREPRRKSRVEAAEIVRCGVHCQARRRGHGLGVVHCRWPRR